jgi:hypothetical protein
MSTSAASRSPSRRKRVFRTVLILGTGDEEVGSGARTRKSRAYIQGGARPAPGQGDRKRPRPRGRRPPHQRNSRRGQWPCPRKPLGLGRSRRHYVVYLGLSASVLSRRSAHPAEVESERRDAQGLRHLGQPYDHRVIHVHRVERVRMADHEPARAGPGRASRASRRVPSRTSSVTGLSTS